MANYDIAVTLAEKFHPNVIGGVRNCKILEALLKVMAAVPTTSAPTPTQIYSAVALGTSRQLFPPKVGVPLPAVRVAMWYQYLITTLGAGGIVTNNPSSASALFGGTGPLIAISDEDLEGLLVYNEGRVLGSFT